VTVTLVPVPSVTVVGSCGSAVTLGMSVPSTHDHPSGSAMCVDVGVGEVFAESSPGDVSDELQPLSNVMDRTSPMAVASSRRSVAVPCGQLKRGAWDGSHSCRRW